MKYRLGLAALSLLLSSAAIAGPLTVPNTFSSGGTARAGEVNDNFAAVKTEVDDNDGRITTNATAIATKQNTVTGVCPAGQSIREINEDGTVTCEVDTVISYTAGSGLALTGTTFSLPSENNVVSVSSLSGVPRNSTYATAQTSSACADVIGRYGNDGGAGLEYLVVPIQIPHNATVTEFKFIVCDNDAAFGTTAFLYRSNGSALASTGTTSVEMSTTVFTKSTTAIISAVIDNQNYSYYVYLPVRGASGINIVPISAVVSYTLP